MFRPQSFSSPTYTPQLTTMVHAIPVAPYLLTELSSTPSPFDLLRATFIRYLTPKPPEAVCTYAISSNSNNIYMLRASPSSNPQKSQCFPNPSYQLPLIPFNVRALSRLQHQPLAFQVLFLIILPQLLDNLASNLFKVARSQRQDCRASP